ncbi:MAG TPA: MBL fold metallo-hydrolase [Steroidobacteraceae bacterium]|nr:MBL fold metallo-hydrolase [Steroidobacteraceae bacterium]
MRGGLVNRRGVLRGALGVAVAAALPGCASTRSGARTPVVSTALNERLLLVSGLGGNVVALHGEGGLLLVDSGAPGATARLQKELDRFAHGAPVRTLINTHWHAAQTGGNETFGKAGAKIIAHAKAAQRMAVDQYVPWEDRYTRAMPTAAVPTEVFYVGSRELAFGGEHIEYGYLQQPHTDGDLYVYFRDSNVLLVGDAVAPVSDPVICWYEGGWVGGRVDSQAKLLGIGNEQTRIIAGTGGVISRAEVKTEHEAMEKVFDRMSDAMRKGFTTEDMQKAKLLDGLSRTWSDPDKAIYDAHKSMWAHYNKLSHSIV